MVEVSPLTRSQLATSDPELGHEWISEAYAEHRPRLSGRRENFRMAITSRASDAFRVDDFVHTIGMQAQTGPYRRLNISRLREGRYRVGTRSRTIQGGPGEVAMMDPFLPGWTAWPYLDIEMVGIDLAAAQRVGAEISGLAPEDVHFELTVPVDAARARHWCGVVDHVRRHVLDVPEVVDEPLVRAETFRQLATAALTVFPNNALAVRLDPSVRTPADGAPATVRRATEFIDAHAHDEITVSDIARAAGLGVRGLQHAFRRHRDETPLEYLRRVRLDGAHRELRDADPTGTTTVASVAARWGFAHAGRFSREYRLAHGRSPSETLRG